MKQYIKKHKDNRLKKYMFYKRKYFISFIINEYNMDNLFNI